MSFVIKKRGRPTNAEIAARAATAIQKVEVVKTDEEILQDIGERFRILSILTKGAIAKNVRSVVVTGAPGVGKTYTVENILTNSTNKHIIVRGTLSAINLYMLAYEYRQEGAVIVLDDSDEIFQDVEAINILKALCDSSDIRRVSYMKEAYQLKENDIPNQFEYRGSMIFISNVDFQRFVDDGKNKFAPHMSALMSRSLYLDLQIHDRDTLGVWVENLATSGKIFDIDNIPMEVRPKILQFMKDHRDDLRELSIRTLKKINQLAKTQPDTWESLARVLLLRK
jgi:hypothetical protein